jgi:hypothetical protein
MKQSQTGLTDPRSAVHASPQGRKIAVRGLLMLGCIIIGLAIAILRQDRDLIEAEAEFSHSSVAQKTWQASAKINVSGTNKKQASIKEKIMKSAVHRHKKFVDHGRLVHKAKTVAGIHGVVVLQFLNEGYLKMTLSWICNVRKYGTDKRTLFITTDDAAHRGLLDFDPSLHVILLPFTAPRIMSYGQVAYWKLMAWRSDQIYVLLLAGISVFLTESDAVWFGDASKWIPKHYQGFDFLTINDKGSGTGTGNGCVQVCSF